ncbi:MAG: hypothetical protein ACD_11C00075G0004 [uncultured bacterium]|nr:MAG: hypothetical protein ACD_11C00075G0004 [uncultured bacterium]HBR71271.1 YihA family ribosome biogenesis GTP-binding protein [Candidatus Moranbacteria bacterium]
MIIKSARFIKGVVGTDPILQEKKTQLAFVGRSNVGKSSMINCLVNSRSLVKSSSKPGKTKELNFFLINEKTYFVDLPGYGYAKISQKQGEKIRKLIMWYLQFSETNLKKVVLVIDAKAGPKEFDLEMKALLEESGHSFLVVANKSDKLTQSEMFKMKNNIKDFFPNREVIFFSSKTKRGREELLSCLFEE